MITCFTPHAPFGPQPVPAGVETCAVSAPAGELTALWAAAPEPRGTALLIPGFTGSKEDFLGILPLLADRGWSALAYSQRGQADSAAPAGADAYRLDDFAQDAVAVAQSLAATCGGPVHLLGHSFGGVVAREALLREPTLVASLTLFSSGGGPIAATAERRAQFAQLEQLAANPALRRMRPDVPTEPFADPTDEMLRQRTLATSLDNLVGVARILSAVADRTAELAATGVPAHVIYGENDEAWPLELYEAEARAIGARRTVIPAAAHSAQNENPDAFADAVTDFWRSAE